MAPSEISAVSLAIAAVPALLLLLIYILWSQDYRQAIAAIARMMVQLLAVGYVLLYLFNADSFWVVLLVVAVMVSAASWIALGPVKHRRRQLLCSSLIATGLAGGFVLAVIVLGTLHATPWYAPNVWIPIAGMVFGNAMNAISLAAERYFTELDRGAEVVAARQQAFSTAMIPVVNGLVSVGLVSLPGMMTGQILSGVSPIVASQYQLVIMLAVFSASGLAAALFLQLLSGQGSSSGEVARD